MNQIRRNRPFFSILISCYKIEPFIEQCLESVIDQSFGDFECIILNDGSPGLEFAQWENGQDSNFKHKYLPKDVALDKQLQWIFEQVIKSDPRFRIINKNNEGLSKTKNRGIDESNGKFLVILDGDDYLDLNFLDIAHRSIIHNPNKIRFGSLKTVKNGTLGDYASSSRYLPSVNNLSTMLVFPTWTTTPINYFWNLDLIKEANLEFVSHGKGGEDTCFVWDNILTYNSKLNASVEEFEALPEAIYYYRQFDSQVTKESGFEQGLFTNLVKMMIPRLAQFRKISFKYYLLGRLFVWRMKLYTFRLKNDQNYQGKLAGIFAKILSGVALGVTRL